MLDIQTLVPDVVRPLVLAGALLSTLAFVLLAVLWRDCARRARLLRPLTLGALELRPEWMARGWILLLVISFVAGLRGLPLASEGRTLGIAPEPVARGTAGDAGPARTTATSLHLPFWIRAVEREETLEGRRLVGSVRDTLQLPWPFLAAGLLYWLLAVRTSRPASGDGVGPAGGRSGARGGTGGRAGAILLALAAALVVLPAPRQAVAGGCGGTDGPLCYTHKKCERFLIVLQRCTTEYAYYPEYV